MPRLLAAFPLLIALLAAPASGQPTSATSVSGTVRDAQGQPLPGASVYLSGTTRGAASGGDGRFRIEAVAPGTYRLVGSMVGFKPAGHVVRLAPGTAVTVDLALAEATAPLAPVAVEAQADRRWQRMLARFRRTLLGESANADSTRILNPEVLDLRSRRGTLEATALAPLVIENRALGYRLHYDLTEFRAGATAFRYGGDEVFEALVPASAAEAFRWAAARRRAWRGSLQHLMRSLLGGSEGSEGFVLETPAPRPFLTRRDEPGQAVTSKQLVRTVDGVPTLLVADELEVLYNGEPEDERYPGSAWFLEHRGRADSVQHSRLTVEGGAAALNPDGTSVDPFAVTARGHMAFERLADRVPRDFLPLPE